MDRDGRRLLSALEDQARSIGSGGTDVLRLETEKALTSATTLPRSDCGSSAVQRGKLCPHYWFRRIGQADSASL